MPHNYIITVYAENDIHPLEAHDGDNLRLTLMEAGFDPYGRISTHLNCGGRGLCATCGVWMPDGPPPTHWHDKLAAFFGYPRLTCQVTIHQSITIRLIDDKMVWGQRATLRRWLGLDSAVPPPD